MSSEEIQSTGQRVVIETEDKIIDLGNADVEVMDKSHLQFNLTEDKSQIEVTPDGNILYDGNEFEYRGTSLPVVSTITSRVRSLEYLKDAEGNTTMLEGQSAQDAYQILLDQFRHQNKSRE